MARTSRRGTAWFLALRWGGLGLLTAVGLLYTRRNVRAADTRAAAQFYGVGESMIPGRLLENAPSAWWVVLSPRQFSTQSDSTSCGAMATAAAAARARLLMVGTCLPTDKPLVLSAEDSVRMSSALLMLQRAHLTALLISPDGGYVFGTRELASDAPAIRALLHHAP